MTLRQKAWLLPAAALSVTLGILLGRELSAPLPAVLGLILTAAAALLLRSWGRWFACLGLGLSLACLSAAVAFHPALPPEGTYRIAGVLADEVRAGARSQWKTTLVDVTLDGVPLSGGAYWTFYGEEAPPELQPGRTVSFSARLYHPEGRVNPDGYDFRETLLRDHMIAGLFGCEELSVTFPARFSPAGFAAALRARLAGMLVSRMGEEAGGYAAALLLGTRSLVPSEDRAAFSRLGIAHVLSVSGFHVGLVVGFLALLFRFLRLPQRLRLLLYGVLLLLYSALCGMNQPVLRASILTLLALEGRILNRPRSGLHLLCAAYILLALLSPPQLFGASFQLSFGAMLGLVLVTPFLQRCLQPRSRFLRALWGSLTVCLGAQVGILLPELAFFQSFPLLSLLLNLPAGLLASALIGLDWLVLLLSPLPTLSGLLAIPAVRFTEALLGGVRAMGALPGITLWTPAPTFWTGLGILGLLFAASGLVRLRPRTRLPILAASLAITALSLLPAPHSATEYIQFSVGNADAAVLWDQDQVIVLDTGESDGVLSGFLRRRRLIPDAVILTHLHLDHAGGLAAMLSDGIPVPVCYLPWGAREALVDEGVLALLDQLAASGTEFRTLSRGDSLPLPSGSLSVLWPESGKVRPRQDANESSLALLLNLHGVTLLQTGDLDGRYEMYAAHPADLLKVAHHGSVSSTAPAFLEAVSPRAALLSCSRPDRHLEMAGRLGEIPLWSTAVGGALTVTFRPQAFEITPYLIPPSED